jgi:hypothetical protein
MDRMRAEGGGVGTRLIEADADAIDLASGWIRITVEAR